MNKCRKIVAFFLSLIMVVGMFSNANFTMQAKASENNVTTIYYANDAWNQANIHYKVGNGSWTSVPGVKMEKSSEQTGYTWKYVIDLGSSTNATICFNNGNGSWDSRNGGNYSVNTGIYGVKNQQVKQLQATATSAPTETPTVTKEPLDISIQADVQSPQKLGTTISFTGRVTNEEGYTNNNRGFIVKKAGTEEETQHYAFPEGNYKYSFSWTPKETGTYTISFFVSENGGRTGEASLTYKVTDTTNTATIYYANGNFSNANIHYKVGNGSWTSVPGVQMEKTSEMSGYTWKYVIDLGDAENATVCFNNGSGSWDSKNGANYTVKAGVSGIKNQNVVTLTEIVATPVVTEEPTTPPTEEPTTPPTEEPTTPPTETPTIPPTETPTVPPTETPTIPPTETPTTPPTPTPVPITDKTVYMSGNGRSFSESIEQLKGDTYGKKSSSVVLQSVKVTKEKPSSSKEMVYLQEETDDDVLIAYFTVDELSITGVYYVTLKLYTEADKIVLPEDCSYMFANWYKTTSIDFSFFDTSRVTNMSYMFYGFASSISDCDLNLNFDTSNVTDMSHMFESCGVSNLKFGNKFDTSKVTNMSYMFYLCGEKHLKSLTLGNNFDTSKVTDMSYMFASCGKENMISLHLGNKFDTSNVINMENMFAGCGYKNMTSLSLGNKFDTSKVTNMSNMFIVCGYYEMVSLNLGNNFDTSNVTNMENMFDNCGYKSMTSLNLGKHFNTSKVTDMSSMFANCGYEKMVSLNLGNKFDTSKVTDMSFMFEQCGYMSMVSLSLGDKFDVSQVTVASNMFSNCGYKKMEIIDLGAAFMSKKYSLVWELYKLNKEVVTIYVSEDFLKLLQDEEWLSVYKFQSRENLVL